MTGVARVMGEPDEPFEPEVGSREDYERDLLLPTRARLAYARRNPPEQRATDFQLDAARALGRVLEMEVNPLDMAEAPPDYESRVAETTVDGLHFAVRLRWNEDRSEYDDPRVFLRTRRGWVRRSSDRWAQVGSLADIGLALA